jgi:hypothetical protein
MVTDGFYTVMPYLDSQGKTVYFALSNSAIITTTYFFIILVILGPSSDCIDSMAN